MARKPTGRPRGRPKNPDSKTRAQIDQDFRKAMAAKGYVRTHVWLHKKTIARLKRIGEAYYLSVNQIVEREISRIADDMEATLGLEPMEDEAEQAQEQAVEGCAKRVT